MTNVASLISLHVISLIYATMKKDSMGEVLLDVQVRATLGATWYVRYKFYYSCYY